MYIVENDRVKVVVKILTVSQAFLAIVVIVTNTIIFKIYTWNDLIADVLGVMIITASVAYAKMF